MCEIHTFIVFCVILGLITGSEKLEPYLAVVISSACDEFYFSFFSSMKISCVGAIRTEVYLGGGGKTHDPRPVLSRISYGSMEVIFKKELLYFCLYLYRCCVCGWSLVSFSGMNSYVSGKGGQKAYLGAFLLSLTNKIFFGNL